MEGLIKISINRIFKKYLSVLPESYMMELNSLTLQGVKTAYVKPSTLKELDDALAVRKQEAKKMSACANRNNRGIAYEKAGKIRLAIKAYEENIKEGCCPACHAFDRLMILYRKAKDYENEIRVIDRAIEVLCPRYPDLLEKYQMRKIKAKALMEKIK